MTLQKFITTKLGNPTKSTLVKAFADNWDTRKSERLATDIFNPPKVHENAINVYHGSTMANQAVNMRYYDSYFLFLPWVLYPAVCPLIAGQLTMYFAFGRSLIYEPSRRLCLRIDLLPHIESVSIMKVGTFGGIYNEVIRCED